MRFVFTSVLMVLVSVCALAKPISFNGKVLIENPKSKCKIIFKDGAVVAMFCPPKTNSKDMISDLLEIEKKTGWPIPIFEVFSDERLAPKDFKAYERLPNKVPFQTHTVQLKNGQVLSKTCYRRAKTVDCDF